METATVFLKSAVSVSPSAGSFSKSEVKKSIPVNGVEKMWILFRLMVTTLRISWNCYRSFPKMIRAGMGLNGNTKRFFGRNETKRWMKVDGKYYFGIWAPGFPSSIFNRFIQTELNRVIPHNLPVNRLQALQFAITNKCPLHCEHCFEWNNLNREEPFTTDELKKIAIVFQDAGCSIFHFTGGEPLARMKCLEELIREASRTSDCWIATSGLNLTLENALRLKKAGMSGVCISLDDYRADYHNRFRGNRHSYDWVMEGVKNANEAGLVTAFTLCPNRNFVYKSNLEKYMELAKSCGVAFVQWIEPIAVGHYEGKAVSLSKRQLEILEKFYADINYDKQYQDYPLIIYHGYYQRRYGCLAGGYKLLYLDSAGYINACPFCQTRQHQARELLTGSLTLDKLRMKGCPVNFDSGPFIPAMK